MSDLHLKTVPVTRNRSLGQVRQTGSDPTAVGGKMTAAGAPLEVLDTDEPRGLAELCFKADPPTIVAQNCSSSPATVQTPHMTGVFSSGSLPVTASTVPQDSWVRQGGDCSPTTRETPIETDLVEALRSLQGQSNFREMVSTTNDCSQTLAHLSIFYGYRSLLSSLVDWRIDLAIADANGLTALHYAYMKGDLDSVRILRRGGASEIVVDKLGRKPLDLRPEGFELSIDLDNDAKVAVGFDSRGYHLRSHIDEDVDLGVLGRKLGTLGLGDNKNLC